MTLEELDQPLHDDCEPNLQLVIVFVIEGVVVMSIVRRGGIAARSAIEERVDECGVLVTVRIGQGFLGQHWRSCL